MNLTGLKSSTIFFITLFVFSTCSTTEIYQSIWFSENQEKLKADEFTENLKSDKKSKIAYMISNNENAIFVDLYIQNESIQKKAVLFGITAWLDFEGKSKKKLGVKYPLRNENLRQESKKSSRNKLKKGSTGGGEISFAHQAEQMLNSLTEIELIDKTNDRGRIFDLRLQNDLKANIEFKQTGLMAYHLEVPYKTLGISLKDLESKKISIGIETGYLNREKVMPQKGQSGYKQDGRMQSGRMQSGGKRHGGMQAGRNSGMNHEIQTLQKATSFWIKNIRLTQSQ